MVKIALSKVVWVGRATIFAVGLTVVLAVILGVATTALAAVPGDPLKLGNFNTIDRLTTLVRTTPGPALNLRVEAGQPPLAVNSTGKVPRLNADSVDGNDSTAFLGAGQKATDADKLDGRDTTEFVSRSQATAPGTAPKQPLRFVSYFMSTGEAQDYPFGQILIRTTGTPGQFRVCGNFPGASGNIPFVVYVNGVRTAGSVAFNQGCSGIFDPGAGGDFQVSARRNQIFGTHSGDGVTDENYTLMGFNQGV